MPKKPFKILCFIICNDCKFHSNITYVKNLKLFCILKNIQSNNWLGGRGDISPILVQKQHKWEGLSIAFYFLQQKKKKRTKVKVRESQKSQKDGHKAHYMLHFPIPSSKYRRSHKKIYSYIIFFLHLCI